MAQSQSEPAARRSLIHVIATDIHFWIPLAVLIAGFVLLDQLR